MGFGFEHAALVQFWERAFLQTVESTMQLNLAVVRFKASLRHRGDLPPPVGLLLSRCLVGQNGRVPRNGPTHLRSLHASGGENALSALSELNVPCLSQSVFHVFCVFLLKRNGCVPPAVRSLKRCPDEFLRHFAET